jgi:hypothetical protein
MGNFLGHVLLNTILHAPQTSANNLDTGIAKLIELLEQMHNDNNNNN